MNPGAGNPDAANPDIAELERQQRELQLPSFDLDDAWRLGSLIVTLARERKLAVTVDIRHGEQQAFHAALPGTSPDNDDWIRRKAAVVRRFNEASYLVGERYRAKGRVFDLDPSRYAAHGGSFPLLVRGTGVVGTVTVSGLPQVEDHRLVTECLARFLAEGAE
ncbi:heme-degrading domain-containing protein [Kitasatospora sp. SUK 42]|uniref:heme-degrading domain-containing protein n=1 Tax=Kitasatospora sp. SUK 42 TaxID=1588882 RepID=UPI0018CB7455|nr:heme-degrading domain-containing protein [Kitasatospora sp. SUK 42]MBV2156678.1 heme-degrading domain-containing protein [Kitasatospora sp. SUK 42]